MVIERMREISLGRTVYTSDGETLGRVNALRLDGFKIAVSVTVQREYWLPMNCVQSAGDNGLQLSIEKGDLDRFKTSTPRLLTRLPRTAGEDPRSKQRRGSRLSVINNDRLDESVGRPDAHQVMLSYEQTESLVGKLTKEARPSRD